jgi:protein-disulfide isomerase/uncharacterized membrane protein
MYRETLKYLRYLSIPVSRYYLRLQLESHPYFPSLVALKDTLDGLGIKNEVCSGTLEDLRNMNQPFLAHYHKDGGQITFFKSVVTAEKKVKDFRERWSGHVVLIFKTNKWNNEDNKRYYLHEHSSLIFKTIFIVISMFVLIGMPLVSGSLPVLLLTISALIGLYFSLLSSQKEIGIQGTIGDKICRIVKHNSCETVIQSKGAQLFPSLSWSDIGIVYFGTSLLYFLIAQLSNVIRESLSQYYLISLGAGLFPVYSIYYQWKSVKQWCILCMIVVGVLFFNTVITILYIKSTDLTYSNWKYWLIFLLIGVTVFSLWRVGKIIYKKSFSILFAEIKEKKLKRNPRIFSALLSQNVVDPINLPEKNEFIRYGNISAQYQLVVACNPYCLPCAKAHRELDSLFEKYPDKISVSIRFALNAIDDSRKMVAAREILKAAKLDPYEAMKDWYAFIDIEKFRQKYQVNGERIEEIIDYYIRWKELANIKATPTFFINGRRLPELYSWTDCLEILSTEINN